MQAMTVQEIAAAVSGEWINPREGMASVASISTDSRNLEPGCLFVPWVGFHHNCGRTAAAARFP